MEPTARGIRSSPAEEKEVTSKVFLAMRVPVDPTRAFEAFTEEIALWWQPSGLFRVTADGDGRLSFEPGRGGRLLTTLADGSIFEIGRISVWEPGRRLVFTWRQASFSPGQSTEVEVGFEAVGDETRVSIEHRGWDAIPRRHAARHGFPEEATLRRASDWWRASLHAFNRKLSDGD
jgi:uncharacterized protein YndB with AHSA1/START domain